MMEEIKEAVLDAIRGYPPIVRAALTGSFASQSNDQHSDLDVLIVARDLKEVQNVRAWLPQREDILISAFHLTHYCTILLRGHEKIDLAIFSIDDSSTNWIVHDYNVIKGDEHFEAELALAAIATRENRAAHRNPDVSMDNVLLLLMTAVHRVGRSEQLSAHAFIAMACEMVISLVRRQYGVQKSDDLLDPRRR